MCDLWCSASLTGLLYVLPQPGKSHTKFFSRQGKLPIGVLAGVDKGVFSSVHSCSFSDAVVVEDSVSSVRVVVLAATHVSGQDTNVKIR